MTKKKNIYWTAYLDDKEFIVLESMRLFQKKPDCQKYFGVASGMTKCDGHKFEIRKVTVERVK